jgi:hypothetical protein
MENLIFNLHTPLSKLESEKQRRYSYAEIAEIAGLTRQGVRRLLKEPTKQIDVETLNRLIVFFEHEGMPISVSDLFTVTESNK